MSPRLGPEPTKYKKLRAPVDIVRSFWERLEARDWDDARALLADDLVVLWPATRERFEGADTFIALQQAYPGEWHIAVEAVHADGRDVLAWVEVRIGDTLSICAQRATVTEKLIRSSVELWVDEGEITPPAWRADAMARIARTTGSATESVPALNEES
jgi:limonene-1,2-epoxide hydrolase